MRYLVPVFAVVLSSALTGQARSVVQAPAGPEGVFEKEVRAVDQAWRFSGVDLPEGHVATISATGSWKINPLWKRAVGAGGDTRPTAPKARKSYVKSGVNEGCLLVRSGEAVFAFFKDDEVLRIRTPGKIYFCANDEPTEEGLARIKEYMAVVRPRDYVGAIPIPPARDAFGSGFLDNSGALKVRVVVTKAEN